MKLKENFIRFPKAVQKKLQMSWNRFWKNILIFMPLRFHEIFFLNIATKKSRENAEVKFRYSGKATNIWKNHPLCFDITK